MKNEHDDAGLWSLFTKDATVIDGGEGKAMQGADEIQRWIQKAIAGLTHARTRKATDDNGTHPRAAQRGGGAL